MKQFLQKYKSSFVALLFFVIFIILFLSINDPGNDKFNKMRAEREDIKKANTTETRWVFEVNEIIIKDNVLGTLGRVFLSPKKVNIIIRKDPADMSKMKIEIDVVDPDNN